jgi:alanine racemase
MISHDGLSTWLEIDLGAIAHNVQALGRLTGTRVMAVVKANGYGHGLVRAARTAVEAGAAYCGVARIDEALEIRDGGVAAPVLVLGETPNSRMGDAIAHGVSVTVYDHAQLNALAAASGVAGEPVRVHVKVDTGMTRLGATPQDAFGLLQALHDLPGVSVEGLFTHFARADEPQAASSDRQAALFEDLLGEVTSAGLRPPLVHTANSAAALTRPSSRFDMVRPGIAIYGMNPSTEVRLPEGFRSALVWKARLTTVREVPAGTGVSYGHRYVTQKDERLGVIPVGYGDGFRREPGARVLIHGHWAPVVGRVCMDQTIINLDDVPGAATGDEVVIVGRQGEERVRPGDLAEVWGTVGYEVVCGLSARVPRLYQR